MRKPLLIEGDAGVGKTELAKVLARLLGTELIRLQCYEGLDVQTALYEWDYPRQLLRLRMAEGRGEDAAASSRRAIFSRDYLLERPLLRAITRPAAPPVLLIDEVDRADDGFEAFLLELLSDFQVTIPELGTIRAEHPPHVRPHLEPHPGAGRRPAPPLPLPLHRAPEPREGGADHPHPLAGGRRRAWPARSAASCRPCASAGSSSRPASPRPWTGRRRS